MDSEFKTRKPLDYLSLPEKIFAYGFSMRKRKIVRQFLGADRIQFTDNGHDIVPHSALLLWGRAPVPTSLPEPIQIIRIEDGFLRSVGLGADLIQPISWVFDSRGIYFDATQTSDLERFLQDYPFDSDLLARAEKLRQHIIEAGITKYNVGNQSWTRPAAAQKIILVPGQVETDASILFGAIGIRTNLELLKAVRQENPDAYVLYKPHPDVIAGLRTKGRGESEVAAFCDEIIADVSMHDLLANIDEVHVLTSLAGFEALLRGKQVVCYGLPFYAGWGLTRDKLTCSRRSRILSLSALCAGALILYPTYVSRLDGQHITPETALDELIAWRTKTQSISWYSAIWRKLMRRILRHP
ncbi:MAG: hypothetical protein ABIP02_06335 [Arenimonas sp.]